jgi:hypothetical protein
MVLLGIAFWARESGQGIGEGVEGRRVKAFKGRGPLTCFYLSIRRIERGVTCLLGY